VVAATIGFCVGLLALVGCQPTSEQAKAPPETIEKSYESGDVQLRVLLAPSKLTVADKTSLVLEATGPEAERPQFPEPGEKLGEFTIVATHSDPPKLLDNGRMLNRHTYELEPFLAGEYKIPPLEVHFSSAGPDETAQTIVTEELAATVESVVPDATEQTQLDIKENMSPLELPRTIPWWVFLIGIVLLAAAAAGYFYWRKRLAEKAAEPETPPLPHEVAYREIERLLAEKLIEKGESKLFYLRLSNILRHYIEDRFGLRAPERTTEEFLLELRHSMTFDPRHKDLLKSFLRHCDMVKFAELQPTAGEVDGAIGSCKRFVDETRAETVQRAGTSILTTA
jgi:hypothetical protein